MSEATFEMLNNAPGSRLRVAVDAAATDLFVLEPTYLGDPPYLIQVGNETMRVTATASNVARPNPSLMANVAIGDTTIAVSSTVHFDASSALGITNNIVVGTNPDNEIMRVTDVLDATTLAVTRGAEGTTPKAHTTAAAITRSGNEAFYTQLVVTRGVNSAAQAHTPGTAVSRMYRPTDFVEPADLRSTVSISMPVLYPGGTTRYILSTNIPVPHWQGNSPRGIAEANISLPLPAGSRLLFELQLPNDVAADASTAPADVYYTISRVADGTGVPIASPTEWFAAGAGSSSGPRTWRAAFSATDSDPANTFFAVSTDTTGIDVLQDGHYWISTFCRTAQL